MIGSMLLPHTLTVTTPGETTDRYQNTTPVWDPPAATRAVQGYLQPLVTGENTIGREAVEYGYVAFTLETIGAHERVTYNGRTYDVSGPARPWDTPYGAHHFETYLRVTEG